MRFGLSFLRNMGVAELAAVSRDVERLHKYVLAEDKGR